MKNNKFFLPVILVAVLFAVLLSAMIMQLCFPQIILPPINIPNIVLLSVVALLLEHFLARDNDRCYISISVLAVVAFAVLPWVAGLATAQNFWKIGLVGGITFTGVTYLFTSAEKRLKTGPQAPAALIVTGLGIYLASQCFAGILL